MATSDHALPGWELLLTEQGAELLGEVEAQLAAGRSAQQTGAEMRRRGVGPDGSAALLTQADLRRRAATKFGPLAARLLFTPAGLEQATRAQVAATHAERFRTAGCRKVADLGCGLGAESAALIAAGIEVRAVEIDPFTAGFAEHNLAVVAEAVGLPAPEIVVGDAESAPLEGVDAAFLDPARRTSGSRDTRRLTSPDDYSPSLGFAFGLGGRIATGVKLGPGLDRELIPAEAEAQWVSVEGAVVEAGIWFGAVARPGVRRSALVIRGTHAAELTAADDSPDASLRDLGEYLHEPDGAVIRARLIGMLAEQTGAGMVGEGIAYLTTDAPAPSPFVRSFRILEELPVRERDLRRALASRGIGTLEIKKRGADVDPAGLRKRLKLSGPRSATLFLTRARGRHVALLAERLP